MPDNSMLLAFYGDDFTGSTDAMEALAIQGYKTLLFTSPPSNVLLKRFEGVQCIGIAGMSRAKNSKGIKSEIEPIFKFLFNLSVPIIHYKVCSTFDSSPEVGNIGTAIEIAQEYSKNEQPIPVIVGAPELGRYTVFGQHYAKMGDEIYRLDRHPTMSRHPSTPMDEADLKRHLNKQFSVNQKIGLINVLELSENIEEIKNIYQNKLKQNNDILIFDSLQKEHEEKTGELLWQNSLNHSSFVVGSSGVEYALTSTWKKENIKGYYNKSIPTKVNPVEQIFVISGSGSPITQKQIEIASQENFEAIRVMPEDFSNTKSVPSHLLSKVITAYENGKSIIVYTALGPDDGQIQATRKYLQGIGVQVGEVGKWIGEQLGRWTREILKKVNIQRIVIAGGDTSGFVINYLNVFALEMLLSVSPGAPLCKGYISKERKENEEYIEIALKGGQLGSEDYFLKVRDAF